MPGTGLGAGGDGVAGGANRYSSCPHGVHSLLGQGRH